jgi:hypothetical protein
VSSEYGHDQLIELRLQSLLFRGRQFFRIVNKGAVRVESHLTFFFVGLASSDMIILIVLAILGFRLVNLLDVVVVVGVIVVVGLVIGFLLACVGIDL